jgi:hypothetical protein
MNLICFFCLQFVSNATCFNSIELLASSSVHCSTLLLNMSRISDCIKRGHGLKNMFKILKNVHPSPYIQAGFIKVKLSIT